MSFQPFLVQCLTCGSPLRVTNPAVVGTIAACPKCNSMVQIEPPDNISQSPQGADSPQVAVGQSSIDSQAITEDSISVGAPVASTSERGFAGAETLDAGADALRESREPLPEPSVDWQSDRTRRSRQIALVAAVSITSLLAAIVIFTWFVSMWRSRSEPTQIAAADPGVAAADDPFAQARQTDVADADKAGRDESSDDPVVADNPDVLDTPVAEPAVAVEPSDQRPESSPTAATAMADIPDDLLPKSALDTPLLTPADSLESSEPDQVDPPATNPDVPDLESAIRTELPPELSEFVPLLLKEGPLDEPTLAAPPTIDDVRLDAAAVDEDPMLADPKSLNLQSSFGLQVAIASDGYPLNDLTLLIGQLTGVPIQLDWASFDLAQIPLTKTIKTNTKMRKVQEILDEIAADIGGEFREQESLVVLTPSDETFTQASLAIVDLSDFAGGLESATTVLNQFAGPTQPKNQEEADAQVLEVDGPEQPAEDANADDEVGDDEFKPVSSRQQEQLAILAAEALRRMRGIPPKIPDALLGRWMASADEAASWPLLSGGDAGNRLETPIAMADLLRTSARRNQATCLIHWYDLANKGIGPESLLFPHIGVDAATTLGLALQPWRVQVRRVDNSLWWVGSEATYDQLPVVVWTDPLGGSREQFSSRIENIVRSQGSVTFRTAYDPESDRILMLLPRFLARQLPKITASLARSTR